ncbi:MAG: FAD-dependent pyridine nucleotide-disulfide oxidoreductase [Parcubacteria group bacterium GW2011_GWA2_47_26]|nr:MAG: FAD-dependent pyridine nucleotide-disulfide oxidoreductase [Parcubacteria group bacterium GW2011_GWA2_47_26]
MALDLQKKLPSPEWQIYLVDRNDCHLYIPLLYEVATGYFGNNKPTEEILAQGCCLNISQLLGKRVQFLQDEVVRIDCKKKSISLRDGKTLQFSYLVLALGSAPDYFGVPGLEANACTFGGLADALKLRRRISDFIERKRKGELSKINIIIGGGGATGVEFAAELVQSFLCLKNYGVLRAGDWQITLVEALPRLLSVLSLKASALALARLEKQGVKIMLDTCIKSAAPGEIILAPRPLKSGEKENDLVCEFLPEHEKKMKADLIVWAGGIKSNGLLAQCGLTTDRKGRVEVNAQMRVKDMEDVFALGDNALLINPQNNQAVPMLAQAAIAEAKIAAKNIASLIQGMALINYSFPEFPTANPIGGKRAIIVFKNLIFDGFVGWVVRQAADLRYFLSIMPLFAALNFFFRGVRVYTKND